MLQEDVTNFTVIPIPFSQTLKIQSISSNHEANISVRMTDILGRTIINKSTTIEKLNEDLESITQTLNSGSYVIEIIDEHNKKFVEKVIKY